MARAPGRCRGSALLLIVGPLLEPGARVTDAERRACEPVLVRWLDGL